MTASGLSEILGNDGNDVTQEIRTRRYKTVKGSRVFYSLIFCRAPSWFNEISIYAIEDDNTFLHVWITELLT